MLDVLELLGRYGIETQKATPKEWKSPCPFCGGTDRFSVWPARGDCGRWWCRGCGESGDGIDLLQRLEGMGYREAAAAVGRETSSLRGGSRSPRRLAPAASRSSDDDGPRSWRLLAEVLPGPAWQERAELLHAQAVGHWRRPCREALEELRVHRHMTPGQAAALDIGWVDRQSFEAPELWGLEAGGRKIVLPRGLYVFVRRQGGILRVRIRRARSDAKGIGQYGKECSIRCRDGDAQGDGLGRGPYIRGRSGLPVVVTEAEIDAGYIHAIGAGRVTALGLGSCSMPPSADADVLLTAAPRILVALDADAAGAAQVGRWLTQYPQAMPWVPDDAKGPGDMPPDAAAAWLADGLAADVQAHRDTFLAGLEAVAEDEDGEAPDAGWLSSFLPVAGAAGQEGTHAAPSASAPAPGFGAAPGSSPSSGGIQGESPSHLPPMPGPAASSRETAPGPQAQGAVVPIANARPVHMLFHAPDGSFRPFLAAHHVEAAGVVLGRPLLPRDEAEARRLAPLLAVLWVRFGVAPRRRRDGSLGLAPAPDGELRRGLDAAWLPDPAAPDVRGALAHLRDIGQDALLEALTC